MSDTTLGTLCPSPPLSGQFSGQAACAKPSAGQGRRAGPHSRHGGERCPFSMSPISSECQLQAQDLRIIPNSSAISSLPPHPVHSLCHPFSGPWASAVSPLLHLGLRCLSFGPQQQPCLCFLFSLSLASIEFPAGCSRREGVPKCTSTSLLCSHSSMLLIDLGMLCDGLQGLP